MRKQSRGSSGVGLRKHAARRRGASLVQYVMVLGCSALAAMLALQAFGSGVRRKTECLGRRVTSLVGSGVEMCGSSTTTAIASPTSGGAPNDGAPRGIVCNSNGVCRGSNCFAAGTRVDTPQGSVAIESLTVGDVVLSADAPDGPRLPKRITRTFRTEGREVLRLEIASARETCTEDGASCATSERTETLRVTPEHPFHLQGVGFVLARDLETGEMLSAAGGTTHVVALASEASTATVYNFEVEDFHTYFVGDVGAWVHNQCPGPGERLDPLRDRNENYLPAGPDPRHASRPAPPNLGLPAMGNMPTWAESQVANVREVRVNWNSSNRPARRWEQAFFDQFSEANERPPFPFFSSPTMSQLDRLARGETIVIPGGNTWIVIQGQDGLTLVLNAIRNGRNRGEGDTNFWLVPVPQNAQVGATTDNAHQRLSAMIDAADTAFDTLGERERRERVALRRALGASLRLPPRAAAPH